MWCMQPPRPKTSTIVVAALVISDNNKVPDLLPYLMAVLNGLWKKGITIRSYMSDGAAVEQLLAVLLMKEATRTETIMIYHPGINCLDIKIPLLFFGDHLLLSSRT